MHKRIVKALEQLFTEWDKDHQWLDIFVRTRDTGGFWGLCIVVPEERHYIIAHLESIALSVGRIYGEGLCIKKEKNLIIID